MVASNARTTKVDKVNEHLAYDWGGGRVIDAVHRQVSTILCSQFHTEITSLWILGVVKVPSRDWRQPWNW